MNSPLHRVLLLVGRAEIGGESGDWREERRLEGESGMAEIGGKSYLPGREGAPGRSMAGEEGERDSG